LCPEIARHSGALAIRSLIIRTRKRARLVSLIENLRTTPIRGGNHEKSSLLPPRRGVTALERVPSGTLSKQCFAPIVSRSAAGKPAAGRRFYSASRFSRKIDMSRVLQFVISPPPRRRAPPRRIVMSADDARALPPIRSSDHFRISFRHCDTDTIAAIDKFQLASALLHLRARARATPPPSPACCL